MAEIMKEQAQEASVLDALLGATVPNVEKDLPTARYKVDRLSQAAGRDVVFTLRALPYGKVHDLERFNQDADIHILLAGCVEPDLKDPRLLEKFGGLAIPAHIDRASYSLIGVMGLVDPEMGFTVYETTPGCDRQALMAQYQFTGGFLSNSDAHDLIAIADAKRQLEIPERSAPGVIAGVRALGEQKIGV